MERRAVLQQDVGILFSGSVGGFKEKKYPDNARCLRSAWQPARLAQESTLMLHVFVDLGTQLYVFLYSPRDLFAIRQYRGVRFRLHIHHPFQTFALSSDSATTSGGV